MFDRNRRSDAAEEDTGMDDELDKDRFATAAAAEGPAKKPSSGGASVREAAIIGPSIHINGDLRGEEDLLVEGTVNGTVQMQDNTLTIGSNGHISATVYANSVYVDGKLDGDLYGSERVAIRKTGSVTGTIVSPRISLDDGGYFKGTMEMDQAAVDKAMGKKSGSPSSGSDAGASSSGATGGSVNAGTKPASDTASSSAGGGSGAAGSTDGASGAAGKGSKGAGS